MTEARLHKISAKNHFRTANLYSFENRLYEKGFNYIAGVDEAGRGPLAGPIVAAAVILPKNAKIDGLKECKQLTVNKREELFVKITENAVSFYIESIDNKILDSIGLQQANISALTNAALKLSTPADFILVDGYKIDVPISNLRIIKGDMVSASVAAASILAKVHRDRLMVQYHDQYPQYGFDSHKGYGSKKHLFALQQHGPCPIHRRSFSPVAQVSQ